MEVINGVELSDKNLAMLYRLSVKRNAQAKITTVILKTEAETSDLYKPLLDCGFVYPEVHGEGDTALAELFTTLPADTYVEEHFEELRRLDRENPVLA